jgi:hypothetical protein
MKRSSSSASSIVLCLLSAAGCCTGFPQQPNECFCSAATRTPLIGRSFTTFQCWLSSTRDGKEDVVAKTFSSFDYESSNAIIECVTTDRSRRKVMLSLLSTVSLATTLGLSSPSFAQAAASDATTSNSAAAAASTSSTRTRNTGPLDGNLVELPSEAVRSYLQYRGPLQTSADFYLFDLQELLQNVNEWGLVNELFQTSNARGGQGQPNRMERDFVNTMRILSLSMPPSDEADDMIASSLQFAGALQKISKATAGIRRDLPVEIDATAVPDALRGWEDGRVAFNTFLLALNRGMG